MVTYEWTVETVQNDGGDIIASAFFDTCASALRYMGQNLLDGDVRYEWGVMRDEFDCSGDGWTDDGPERPLIDRNWAYVSNGTLQEEFCDTAGKSYARVPKHLHEELAKAWAQQERAP